MVQLLQRHGVRPLLVFDGGPLPVKSTQNRLRREQRTRRESADWGAHHGTADGTALLEQGRAEEAQRLLRKAVAVTPAMSHRLVEELRARGVEFIVAPYEADAQLTHLVQ
eukprot:CAMPEP_0119336392 /NCGR_PEP_ID=MMETSP1333-20130426/91685_1 /TAXON_ID=418940 /ORGANISM="Scyphosphaera apsteinii, Strain RCC1455" /LENGTH=109 /DNA_ID=CAMNT_0007347179 /DNA_START=202 /DNA_END=528 /DNA_ORIENTATION=+